MSFLMNFNLWAFEANVLLKEGKPGETSFLHAYELKAHALRLRDYCIKRLQMSIKVSSNVEVPLAPELYIFNNYF